MKKIKFSNWMLVLEYHLVMVRLRPSTSSGLHSPSILRMVEGLFWSSVILSRRYARVYTPCCVFLISCAIIASDAHARAVASSELINNAKQYDGKVVSYEGEAIGEVMVRGEFAWVNANDGQNALGIWTPVAFARTIKHLGSYQKQGDTILVTGTFHRACRVHGGDLDIHATDFTVRNEGVSIRPALNLEKVRLMINLTIILFLIIIGALLVRIRAARAKPR